MAKRATKKPTAPKELFVEHPEYGNSTAYTSAKEMADDTYLDESNRVAVYKFDRFVNIKTGITVEEIK
jgi:hypothetical protein